ncbi:uncharacterized protein LOC143544815 [Bidens hawaiensis]|uniref:uncharacterized protein LOC143544815 n=1 Tax=Bidens hawaiensis TaxID=980011 RepID=UPI00404AB66F
MEGLTAKVYNGVTSYWRARGYRRLGGPEKHLGRSRRQMWRVRLNRRLKLKLPRSPRKMFISLRDAYVNIMMKLANTSVVRGRTVTGYNGNGFGKTTGKEYDERVIIEICKNLSVRQNHQHQITCSS